MNAVILGYGVVGKGIEILAKTLDDINIKYVYVRKEKENLPYFSNNEDMVVQDDIDIVFECLNGLEPANTLIQKALKKGKILAFLADQDAGEGGAWIKFLGKPASTPLGPAAFSKRLKSPILPVFIVRQQSGKHKVIVKEALYYENTGNDLQDEYAVTVKMTRVIEDIIIANPSQWLWFQKRWNTTAEMMKHNLLIDKD